MPARSLRPILLLACGALAGCTSEEEPAPGLETLAGWGLFADATRQVPAAHVVPYDVVAPLYSDYTFKRRFVTIPEGTTIGYEPTARWRFPVGTILVKTFSYLHDERDPSLGERLLETRLLVHDPGTWTAYTYVWNEAQTEATLTKPGAILPVAWIDAAGEPRQNDYIVPNLNECEDCHGKKPAIDTLGGRTRQLNRDHDYGAGPENQIDYLAARGWLDMAPPADRQTLVDPFGDAPLDDRVRSYLDANCGHCHTDMGGAAESGLLLSWELTAPSQPSANWGVCKTPTSAGGATCGHTFDVVPGSPDTSIMMCRLEADDPKVRMPPLVSRLPHLEGNALVRAWIEAMEPADCGP